MKRFVVRRLIALMVTSGIVASTSQVNAAGFQIWEQDGASIGNYHAGYAAEANDASTAWYNPAGMTRIHNQQLVIGVSAIDSDFEYKGSVGVTEISPVFPVGFVPTTVTFNNVKANGGALSFVPNLQYVAPINESVSFGLSVVVPFGLKTDYGKNTPLRYAATRTGITVIDISPSLGFKMTEKASFGLGLDVQKAEAEFNSIAGLIDPAFLPADEKTIITEEDTRSKSKASDTGYGFHFGGLYEFNPNTRVGLSYHSQVVHHFTGKSTFDGPIAALVTDSGVITSRNAKADVTLPAYTALSAYHQVNPAWAVMGTVIYTQWHVFNKLKLQNVAGVVNDPDTLIASSTAIDVIIPEHYQNTWNIALGANYFASENVILRAGIGYDQTPARNAYRNVQLPDSDRYALSLGGHYQATKTIGLDVGWTHIFFNAVKVNPPAQVTGAATISTNGKVNGNANVFSGQITWDIT